MSLTGKILFADTTSHIFSGDDIKLIIEIENQENVLVKEICLNFRGEIIVKWEDLINKPKDLKIIYIMQIFEDKQTLFDKHITLQTMDVLNKGKYHYNVALNIPQEMPESVKRKYGSVNYELELIVYYTGGVEVLCNMPIYVKQYSNVCLYKEYMRPFHTVLKKSFCYGICNLQPLKLILTLPNTVFLAGETFTYFIKIENYGKLLDLQRLSVILIETQHYKAFKPKARTRQTHTTLNQIAHWFNENHHNSKLEGSFQLPQSLTPSSTSNFYISTSYNLHFIIVFKKFHTDGYISIPIIIGSHKDDAAKQIGDCIGNEIKLQIERDPRTEIEV